MHYFEFENELKLNHLRARTHSLLVPTVFKRLSADDKICCLKQGKFKLMDKIRFSHDDARHFYLERFPVTISSAIPRFIIIHLFSSFSYQA